MHSSYQYVVACSSITAHVHLGREAVPAGGDGNDEAGEREALGKLGPDAAAGAMNVGRRVAAARGDIVGVAAVVGLTSVRGQPR